MYQDSVTARQSNHGNRSIRRIIIMTSEGGGGGGGLESLKRRLVIPCQFPIFLQFDRIQGIGGFGIKYSASPCQLILCMDNSGDHTQAIAI